MKEKIKTFRQIQREESILVALEHTFLYLSPIHSAKKLPNYQPYQSRRVDNTDRFEMMMEEIESDDGSLLDIGCADAQLTSKFAERNLFCIGIEQRQDYIEYAIENTINNPNIGIVQINLSPNNIKLLPEFDVVLLLTVYKHFSKSDSYSEYGGGYNHEKSESMLSEIAKKPTRYFLNIKKIAALYLMNTRQAGFLLTLSQLRNFGRPTSNMC